MQQEKTAKNGPYSMEYLGGGKIKTGIYAGSPPTWAFSTTESSLSLNVWHHIVMTYDGAHMMTYGRVAQSVILIRFFNN